MNDLLIYSRLDGDAAQDAFRLAVKKRFYIREQHLFPGAADKLKRDKGGLSEPYIYNEIMEDDQFARKVEEDAADETAKQQAMLLGGMAGKIRLD